MGMHPATVLTAADLHFRCQVIGERHAGAHRFTMKQLAVISAHRFKRMGECVPQIEQGALARLALVGLDDTGLGLA